MCHHECPSSPLTLLACCKQKQGGLSGFFYVAGPPLLNEICTSLLRAPVSEMTYTASSGTLNSTIPYYSSPLMFSLHLCQGSEGSHGCSGRRWSSIVFVPRHGSIDEQSSVGLPARAGLRQCGSRNEAAPANHQRTAVQVM